MLKRGKVFCDICKHEMERHSADNDCDPHGFDFHVARMHLCEPCWCQMNDEAWKERDPCAECETQPCKRGRDCWFNPTFPGVPYETYFADRVPEKKENARTD